MTFVRWAAPTKWAKWVKRKWRLPIVKLGRAAFKLSTTVFTVMTKTSPLSITPSSPPEIKL
ncbi:hypothetical protein J1614_010973 [Plenodomus biglobosus]|nr:hypothetical protein J1614_010973 [Plenodomus biglobosus]